MQVFPDVGYNWIMMKQGTRIPVAVLLLNKACEVEKLLRYSDL